MVRTNDPWLSMLFTPVDETVSIFQDIDAGLT